jgi:hypothetical protein
MEATATSAQSRRPAATATAREEEPQRPPRPLSASHEKRLKRELLKTCWALRPQVIYDEDDEDDEGTHVAGF